MTRARSGKTVMRSRKRLRKLTKGFRLSRHNLVRQLGIRRDVELQRGMAIAERPVEPWQYANGRRRLEPASPDSQTTAGRKGSRATRVPTAGERSPNERREIRPDL